MVGEQIDGVSLDLNRRLVLVVAVCVQSAWPVSSSEGGKCV